MALEKVTVQSLIDVADAIRDKGNTASPLEFPQGFIDAVDAIEGGGDNWKEEFADYIAGAACELPDTANVLSDYAFYNYAAMTNEMFAKMPPTITEIGDYCFAGDSQLTSIDLSGKSLMTVGDHAFDGCSGATLLDLSDNDLTTLGEYMVSGMSSLQTLDISDNPNLKIIPANFANGNNFPVLIWADSPIEEIGEAAFRTTTSVSRAFPFTNCTTLKIIGPSAFRNKYTTNYQTLDLSGCTALETIGNDAFSSNPDAGYGMYSTIILPASLKTIGSGAFWHNAASVIDFSRCVNLETIGDNAFSRNNRTVNVIDLSRCTKLKSLGANLFYNQYGITTIKELKLPPNVTLESIGNNCFRGAHLADMTSLEVRSNWIGGDCFNSLTGPTRVDVYGCEYYGVAAFGDGSSITEAHIHTKPNSFAYNITTYPVFNGCSNLTDIYVPWSSGEVQENRFVKSTQHPTWHYNYVW